MNRQCTFNHKICYSSRAVRPCSQFAVARRPTTDGRRQAAVYVMYLIVNEISVTCSIFDEYCLMLVDFLSVCQQETDQMSYI